jgi:hypothetical protein
VLPVSLKFLSSGEPGAGCGSGVAVGVVVLSGG